LASRSPNSLHSRISASSAKHSRQSTSLDMVLSTSHASTNSSRAVLSSGAAVRPRHRRHGVSVCVIFRLAFPLARSPPHAAGRRLHALAR
jgi:hypothetical protein